MLVGFPSILLESNGLALGVTAEGLFSLGGAVGRAARRTTRDLPTVFGSTSSCTGPDSTSSWGKSAEVQRTAHVWWQWLKKSKRLSQYSSNAKRNRRRFLFPARNLLKRAGKNDSYLPPSSRSTTEGAVHFLLLEIMIDPKPAGTSKRSTRIYILSAEVRLGPSADQLVV